MSKLGWLVRAAVVALSVWAIPHAANAQLSQFMGSDTDSGFERRETGGRPAREVRESRSSRQVETTEEAYDYRYAAGQQVGSPQQVEAEYSRTNYPQNPGVQSGSGFWGGRRGGSWFGGGGPEVVEYDPNAPIEIWLSAGHGRFGNHTFQALGGRPTQPTPKGSFRIQRKVYDYWSKKYDAPMPRAIFFTDACAIHVGSLETMSRGCIHVDWTTGELLYEAARTGRTRVIIHP